MLSGRWAVLPACVLPATGPADAENIDGVRVIGAAFGELYVLA